MSFVLKIVKGALIGVALVIPGVSGSSMAMSMGIYDQLIGFITADKTMARRARGLLPYGIGALLGILVFSYFIEIMFERYPLPTACLFTGMILGAFPMLFKKVKSNAFRASHGIIFMGTVAFVVLLSVAGRGASNHNALPPTLRHALLAVLLGVAGAGSMIIPGVSGSMVLLMLGFFEPVLRCVNQLTASLLRLSWTGIWESLVILGPFALGVVLGMMVMARGIRALLKHYPLATYYGILGLVAASPFAIFYQQTISGGFWIWVVSVACVSAGYYLVVLLDKGEKDAKP